MTRSKEPRGGIESLAAAGRTQPLCMGRLLYQLSHWAPQNLALRFIICAHDVFCSTHMFLKHEWEYLRVLHLEMK